MPTSEPRLLDVLVGMYKDVPDAMSDYEAVRELYHQLGASSKFDAAVVSKSPEG